MRHVLNMIRKLMAFLLSVFAIFATIFVLLLLSFNEIFLTPQTYTQAFAENKVYEQLPAITANEFTFVKSQLVEPCAESLMAGSCLDSNANNLQPGDRTETGRFGPEGSVFINGLNQDQWEGLVTYLLTPEYVQQSLDAGMGQVISYLKGETDTAGLPLLDLKTRLTALTEAELTELLLHSQPLCTLEQQTIIMSGGLGEAGSPPIFCSASAGTSQVLVRALQQRLNPVAEELPEQITFIRAPSPSLPRSLQTILGKDLQAALKTLQVNARYLPFLPPAVLAIVTILGVRSLRSLLLWWSIPIFIAGLLTILPGAILFFMFDQIWLNYLLTSFPPLLTSGYGKLMYGVLHSLSKAVSQHVMAQAAMVTLIALGILFISNRVPAPPDPSLPPLAPPGTPGGPVLNPNRKKKKW